MVPTDSLEAKRGLCLSHSNTSQSDIVLRHGKGQAFISGAAMQCPIFSEARRRCYEADRGKQAHGGRAERLSTLWFERMRPVGP